MISCIPWKIWKHEIKLLPISAKTLFANRGINIEILEAELKIEGYLHLDETLLEVLKNSKRLLINKEEENFGGFPNNWTEEDFLYYKQLKERSKHGRL